MTLTSPTQVPCQAEFILCEYSEAFFRPLACEVMPMFAMAVAAAAARRSGREGVQAISKSCADACLPQY